MRRYFLLRLLSVIFSLFFVFLVSFVIMKLIPGSPFLSDQNVPIEIVENLYKQYELDKPIYVQFWIYVKKFITFEFGSSLIFENRSVYQIIKEAFPVSFLLGIQALILSLVLGVLFGTISAMKKKKWPDNLFLFLFSLGISIPSFLLATFLQYIFSMKLSLFPIAKWGTFSHSVLPSISLAILPASFISRFVRDNMIEILEKDFIKLAKSKGLSWTQIIWNHLLKNSLLPVMGYIAPLSVNILLGSFVIEKIFGIPGLGGWLLTSILSRDYPVIMGLCVFFALFLMVTIFIFDLLYFFLDPRTQIEKE